MSIVLDTSVFVAQEQRGLDVAWEGPGLVSAVTVGELALGADVAVDPDVRAIRRHTLFRVVDRLRVLPVDEAVGHRYGALMATQRRRGRRPSAQDTLIAATAIEHGLPLLTQDIDFLAFEGLDVILV